MRPFIGALITALLLLTAHVDCARDMRDVRVRGGVLGHVPRPTVNATSGDAAMSAGTKDLLLRTEEGGSEGEGASDWATQLPNWLQRWRRRQRKQRQEQLDRQAALEKQSRRRQRRARRARRALRKSKRRAFAAAIPAPSSTPQQEAPAVVEVPAPEAVPQQPEQPVAPAEPAPEQPSETAPAAPKAEETVQVTATPVAQEAEDSGDVMALDSLPSSGGEPSASSAPSSTESVPSGGGSTGSGNTPAAASGGDGIIWGQYAFSGGAVGAPGAVKATYHFYSPEYATSTLYCADAFAPILNAGNGKQLLEYPWTAYCPPGDPMTQDKCGRHLKATNPATGQSVVLTVVDMCGHGGIDMDPVGFNAIDGDGAGVRDGHMMLNLEWV